MPKHDDGGAAYPMSVGKSVDGVVCSGEENNG